MQSILKVFRNFADVILSSAFLALYEIDRLIPLLQTSLQVMHAVQRYFPEYFSVCFVIFYFILVIGCYPKSK